MTVGILEQPLGNARLHVARLVAALLQTNSPSICQELCNLATMDLLLVGSSLLQEDLQLLFKAFPLRKMKMFRRQ